MIGKTAVWKVRVHGPAKFAERTDEVVSVVGNSVLTKGGKSLRLIDHVDHPDKVVGGGSWSIKP